MRNGITFLSSSLFLALLLTVFFQNCSQVNFQPLDVLASKSLTSGNNGDGYEGKPDGDFYRMIPDFTCEDKETYTAAINIRNGNVSYTENKEPLCSANTQTLDPALIDASVYQNQIIGYREGIFEGYEQAPDKIPANLVEVWCRDTNDLTGIETITYFNRLTSEAVTRVYHTAGQINDFPVSRLASVDQIRVEAGEEFQLVVNRDQPALQLGLFQASLNIIIDGVRISRSTSCRLGGSVDPKVWPVKQIIDLNINSDKSQFSPDNKAFAFLSSINSIPHLFYSDLMGENQHQLTPSNLVSGVIDFSFPSTRSDVLVYYGDSRQPRMRELFTVNIDGTNQRQLGAQLIDLNQSSVYGRLQFSADGSQIIYEDASHEPAGSDMETWIRSIPLDGGTPQIINPQITLPDVGTHHYVVNSKNRIAFLIGFTYGVLYLSDLNGSNQMQPPVPGAGSANVRPTGMLSSYIPYWEQLIPLGRGDYIHFKTYNSGSTDFREFVVAMDGSLVRALPINMKVILSDQLGSQIFLALQKNISPINGPNGGSQFQDAMIINVTTGKEISIPSIGEPFFTKNSSQIIGIQQEPDGQWQPVGIRLEDGQAALFCPEAKGSFVRIQEMQDNHYLISAFDEQNQALNIYTFSSGTCVKRNAFPSQKPYDVKAIFNGDFTKLVLQIMIKEKNYTDTQAIYVPLDGKPPLKITSPVFLGAGLLKIKFINNDQSIWFMGNQTHPSEFNAYLWHLPKGL